MSKNSNQPHYHVLVAIREQNDFWPLLNMGYTLAKSHEGKLTIITVRLATQDLEWLKIPSAMTDIPIETIQIESDNPAKEILKTVKDTLPNLLLVGWKGTPPRRGFMLGSTLDRVLRQARCDLTVVKASPDWPDKKFIKKETIQILTPTAGGPNTPLALNLALRSSKQSKVTAIYVMPPSANEASLAERERWLVETTAPWAHNSNFKTKLVLADGILKGVTTEAENYDVTILGITNESMFNQVIFGAIPQQIAAANKGTTVLVKKFQGDFGSIARRVWWQTTYFLPSLSHEERVGVYKEIRRGARPNVYAYTSLGGSS